jgi:ribA/ribD-fused uncharacterized protein
MLPGNTNWLIKNKLMVGGLPRDKKAFDQIKLSGITVFINLMRKTEYQSDKKKPKFDYRDKDHENIEYYNYQITDMKTLPDNEMIKIANNVVKFLKENKKVYIHCLGGNGRTGALAGIVLHMLYPDMTYKQIIHELQDNHKTRKHAPNDSTPQTSTQYNQLHRIITGKDDIFFYHDTDGSYVLSNLYYRPKKNKKAISLFTVGKNNWYSSESYYQAQKFLGKNSTKYDLEYADIINASDTGGKAFHLGKMKRSSRPMNVDGKNVNTIIKDYKSLVKLRPDWDLSSGRFMGIALVAKFAQNEDLFKYLLGTGNKKLVEYSPTDKYWATYWDKKGENMLGKSLMKVRECFRQHEKLFLLHFKK